jgi:hypothetical protein
MLRMGMGLGSSVPQIFHEPGPNADRLALRMVNPLLKPRN